MTTANMTVYHDNMNVVTQEEKKRKRKKEKKKKINKEKEKIKEKRETEGSELLSNHVQKRALWALS